MHFEDLDLFIDYCFDRQQSGKIDTYTATNWKYDEGQGVCQATLINPFFQQQSVVTLAVASHMLLEKVKRTVSDRYVNQFSQRFGQFNKPTYEVITEYSAWDQLRDIWLIRNNKNMSRVSVPLLFDQRKRQQTDTYNIFVTFFIVPSNEFYNFLISNVTRSDVKHIKDDATAIVKEVYA